jgi:dGTPase
MGNSVIRDRKLLEKLEAKKLAKYAVRSRDSVGREHEEGGKGAGGGKRGTVAATASTGFRLCFQKDRDRILHCKSFRRLDEKTQVFPAFFGDHYRTRLTHTLEVAQISRDLCRRLGLNEDLAEAIALAHDLGHPPFGHAGEDALDEIMQGYDLNFEHNQQSLRVVSKLERLYPGFEGLNLSLEVIEGLKKHQTVWDQHGVDLGKMHLEGQIVNLADEIAYTNHDIDDGLRSGILKLEDLEESDLWKEACEVVEEALGDGLGNGLSVGGEVWKSRVISRVISMMIGDICMTFVDFGCVKAEFSEEMKLKIKKLRSILFEKFYLSDEVKGRLAEGKKMITDLFQFYMDHPEKIAKKYLSNNRVEVAVKDYIAGMTDKFLLGEVDKNLGIGVEKNS